MKYTDRIPYEGKDGQVIYRSDDNLHTARKMRDKARESGLPDDYDIAAALFEKCGYYADAIACQVAADELRKDE